MKKFTLIIAAITVVIAFTASITNPVSMQSAQTKKPIPDNVVDIAKKSCMKCHAEPGKEMALMYVNLSKWDTYSVEKQASKAALMCKMVTKGKMPPKSFKQENPDFKLTKAEIKTICDWSASIKVSKNKK